MEEFSGEAEQLSGRWRDTQLVEDVSSLASSLTSSRLLPTIYSGYIIHSPKRVDLRSMTFVYIAIDFLEYS